MLGAPPPSQGLVQISVATLVYEGDEARLSHAVDARQDRSFPVARGERPRLVVLGGSSVHHAYTASEDVNFPTWLARSMPEVEVLNLGSPGQNSAGLARLADQLDRLAPDLVLVYTGHNDFSQPVFSGQIDTPALWTVPLLQVLSGSWIYTGLQQAHRPLVASDPNQRQGGVTVLTDDTALRSRQRVLANWRDNVSALQARSPAPIVLSTLARNVDWPPTGTLSTDPAACEGFARGIRGRPLPGNLERQARDAAQRCGSDSALALWLEAHRLRQAHDPDAALAAWHQSLDADPLPIRAPAALDDVIVAHAATLGVPVVDLRQLTGEWTGQQLFDDTLHPSKAGARAIAEAMAPALRDHL